MKHELIPLSSPDLWKEALQDIPHAFGHTWENCYAMHLSTGLPTYLYQFKHGDAKVICPISERSFMGKIDIVTPYGFSGFTGNNNIYEFPLYWKKFAKERGYVCGYIGLNPLLIHSSYIDSESIHKHNILYFINLQYSVVELYKKLSNNRKRQLKNFHTIHDSITTDKTILIDFFLSNYHDFFAQRKASMIYNFSFETLSYLAGLDNVIAIGVFQNDQVEAVSLFAYTDYVGEYLFNVSLPQGQKYTVPLIWHAIHQLKALNIPFLNLGGGVSENDSIAQFKERFGAEKLDLTALKQVYNPADYEMLCKKRLQNVEYKSGYFPAYRSP